MKKIYFLVLLSLIIIPSTYSMKQSDEQEAEAVDYSLLPKDRPSIEKAVQESQKDCIDTVIGLLSSLEHEQNLRQSAQQDATSCRLELEDLKDSKIKRKSVDSEIRHIKDENQKNIILKAELKKQEAVIAAERESHDKTESQLKELQKALEAERQDKNELKLANERFSREISQKDADAKEHLALIAQLQKEVEQERRALHDLASVYDTEKVAWQSQTTKQQEVVQQCTEQDQRINELESALKIANEKRDIIPALEEKIQVATKLNEELLRQVEDAASIKSTSDKQVAELQSKIAQLTNAQQRTLAQELEEIKTNDIMAKNKAISAHIDLKMTSLLEQLAQIQKLLPELH